MALGGCHWCPGGPDSRIKKSLTKLQIEIPVVSQVDW